MFALQSFNGKILPIEIQSPTKRGMHSRSRYRLRPNRHERIRNRQRVRSCQKFMFSWNGFFFAPTPPPFFSLLPRRVIHVIKPFLPVHIASFSDFLRNKSSNICILSLLIFFSCVGLAIGIGATTAIEGGDPTFGIIGTLIGIVLALFVSFVFGGCAGIQRKHNTNIHLCDGKSAPWIVGNGCISAVKEREGGFGFAHVQKPR